MRNPISPGGRRAALLATGLSASSCSPPVGEWVDGLQRLGRVGRGVG